MIKIVVDFIAMTTVRTMAYVYDDDDNLVDPTDIKVTIVDPAGDEVADEEDMTQYKKDGTPQTGTYEHYLYTTEESVKGEYSGIVVVTDGIGKTAKVSTDTYKFRLR